MKGGKSKTQAEGWTKDKEMGRKRSGRVKGKVRKVERKVRKVEGKVRKVEGKGPEG